MKRPAPFTKDGFIREKVLDMGLLVVVLYPSAQRTGW